MHIPRRHFISCVALAAMSLSLYGQELTLPLKPGSVRFAVIGDMGTGELPQYEVAEKMNRLAETFPFDFVIMLGDNIYGGHNPSDYRNKFELPYKLLLDAGVKFYACSGQPRQPQRAVLQAFQHERAAILHIQEGQCSVLCSGQQLHEARSNSHGWRRSCRTQDRTGKSATFITRFIRPASFHGPSTELRLSLEPLFVKYGVQVVFAGHEHVYERTKPQNGITYFTEGAAGELRKGNLKKTDLTAAGYDQDRSFILDRNLRRRIEFPDCLADR